MARDLLGRPPLKVSELPPGQVRLFPGEPRAVVCPGCSRWLVPHDGGLRRHAVSINSQRQCGESGRRVWFDLAPAEWQARLESARRSQCRPYSLDRATRDALAAAPAMLAAHQAARREPDLSRLRIPTGRGWTFLRRNGAI